MKEIKFNDSEMEMGFRGLDAKAMESKLIVMIQKIF